MRFAPGRILSSILALFLVTVLSAQPLSAWDSGGHELVATLALDQLNPKARQAVNALAAEMSRESGHTYDAVSLACWMDDLRHDPVMPNHGKFLSWHYIDIGLEPNDPMPSFRPGDDNEIHGNVVQALKRSIVVLQGGTDPYVTSKAMACALVMHLVGDIHQPLHCATKYFVSNNELRQDFGGNKEDVINGPPNDLKFNLHAFWDSAWRASFDVASGRVVLDSRFHAGPDHDPELLHAVAIETKNTALPPNIPLETNIDAWARESNVIACDFVYRELTATDNKKYCRLSSTYVSKSNLTARQRLVVAAARLAILLNQTLGANSLIKVPPSYPAGPPGLAY